MNKFVIACFARTGSYRLVDILNQQEGIVCHGEVFKKGRVEVGNEYLEKLSFKRSDAEKRDSDPIRFIDELFGVVKSDGAISSGFKIFPSHSQKVLEYTLTSKDFSVIFLCRNPLQQYISLKMAKNTGVWIKQEGGQGSEIGPIDFNPEDFTKRMNLMFSYYNKVRLLTKVSGKKMFEIDYSDSLGGQRVSDLVSHVGGKEYSDVVSPHRKIIEKSYGEVVRNWGDAKNFLSSLGVDENMSFFDFYKNVMK